MYFNEYKKNLLRPKKTVAPVPEICTIVHGMAVSEPPALLKALADKARSGGFKEV